METPFNPSAAQDCYSPPTPHKLLGTSRVFVVLWNMEKVVQEDQRGGHRMAASRAMNTGEGVGNSSDQGYSPHDQRRETFQEVCGGFEGGLSKHYHGG